MPLRFAPAILTLTLTKLSVVEQDVTEENSWGHNVLGPHVLEQDVDNPSQQILFIILFLLFLMIIIIRKKLVLF